MTLLTIVANAKVPALVGAGVGTAADDAVAMELGCAGVLMNTAIAAARNPVLMARTRFASASSPIAGLLF